MNAAFHIPEAPRQKASRESDRAGPSPAAKASAKVIAPWIAAMFARAELAPLSSILNWRA